RRSGLGREDLDGFADSRHEVLAHRFPIPRTGLDESAAGEHGAPDLLRELLEPRHLVHRRTDDRKRETFRRSDVAEHDVADVEREPVAELRHPAAGALRIGAAEPALGVLRRGEGARADLAALQRARARVAVDREDREDGVADEIEDLAAGIEDGAADAFEIAI